MAHGISSVVVSVTSRPPGPIPVDAKETQDTIDPLRTPAAEPTAGEEHAGEQPPACGVATPQNPMPYPCDIPDEDSEDHERDSADETQPKH